jgi:putative endonuclease
MNRFYYVYVLRSLKDQRFYIGSTKDLKASLSRHNRGFVNATKSRLPIDLVFYEAYRNKFDALRREDYLKTAKGKTTLKKLLEEYLKLS